MLQLVRCSLLANPRTSTSENAATPPTLRFPKQIAIFIMNQYQMEAFAFSLFQPSPQAAEPGQTQARKRTFELAEEFAKSFKARNNSVICRELLGFDMSTPEGKKAAKKRGSFAICPKIMEDAIEILEEILPAI